MILTQGGFFGSFWRNITRNSVLVFHDNCNHITGLLDVLDENTIIERTCIQGE